MMEARVDGNNKLVGVCAHRSLTVRAVLGGSGPVDGRKGRKEKGREEGKK